MIMNITLSERQYPTYKNSGSPFLGNVPVHWDTPRLKNNLLRNDSGVWSEEPEEKGTIVLRSTEQTVGGQWNLENPARLRLTETQRRAATLATSDLVITKSSGSRDHIGKTTIVTTDIANLDCCFSNFMQRIRVNEHLDPDLLWRYFNNYVGREQLLAEATTTTGLANLNAKIIGNCRIPLPPHDEQAAIVRFLDHADAQIQRYIASKERLIALLGEEQQTLVHQAVTRGLDPSVRFKPSGVEWLGDVPEHWEIRRLRYLIQDKLKYGANAQAEFDNPDWPRYLRITDFTEDGRLREDNIRALPPEVAEEYLVEPGDILLARSGATVGKAFLVPTNPRRMCHAGYLIRARAEQSVIDPRFLFTFTQSHTFDRWRRANLIISTIENISAEKYADLPVPTPTISEQRRILEHLEGETHRIDKVSGETERIITLLQEYRTRLIADVVTGQLDVREAAAQLPDAR